MIRGHFKIVLLILMNMRKKMSMRLFTSLHTALHVIIMNHVTNFARSAPWATRINDIHLAHQPNDDYYIRPLYFM